MTVMLLSGLQNDMQANPDKFRFMRFFSCVS